MLRPQHAESVLDSKAREDCAVVKSALPVQVQFGGPPRLDAIFEFHPRSDEIVAEPLRAEGGEILNLEIARLFQMVIVGHDVRTFLRSEP